MSTFFPSLRKLAWSAGAALLALHTWAQEKQADWPLIFSADGYQVQVFKPQPESFDGTSFTARAAVALQRPTDSSPVFGAIWGNGVLAVDRSERMGDLTTFKVTDARFPGITDSEELARIKGLLSIGIPEHAAPIPIDWLVAALDEEKQSTSSYENTPPEIIYREKPSILVFIDGNPIYEKLKSDGANSDPVYAGTAPEVERVVNTPFFLVRTKGEHWLYGSGLWYSAKDVQGPWSHENKAPSYLVALAAKVDTSTAAPRTDGIIPEVVVTNKPAVLLDLNGAPQMQPFDNSSLMYVTNTDKNLFLDIPTQEYYLLASGRWYATKDMRNGPWRYVAPDDLPADFAKVPEGSVKDGILAHVAGTPAAREAVRDASIPQTAQVDRNSASVNVKYDGAPQFRQITGTDVYSARNASTTVLRIDGTYHVCDNAIWYEGSSPDGPWSVSTSVPSQVNEIPPSDPDYRVRYVYIYDSTPDVVFTGYTPGYLGCYVQGGTVIYGTGYYYNPWSSAYWYPRPYTWGFNMSYNPWYGWGFSPAWGYNWFYPSWNYYGYYNPYAWGWWGPYAYCPNSYSHYQGYYGHRGSFGGSSGGNGSRPASGLRTDNLYANHPVSGVRPSETGRTQFATSNEVRTGKAPSSRTEMKPIQGDHFTDSDGNVYRTVDGKTEELRNTQWTKVPEKRPTTGTGTDRDNSLSPIRQVPAKQEPPANAPATRQPAPSTVRTPTNNGNNDPQRIRDERNRGDQRVNDFREYQRTSPAAQPQRTTPPQRTPSTAPRQNNQMRPSAPPPSPSPSRSAPAGNRGGGSGGRQPR